MTSPSEAERPATGFAAAAAALGDPARARLYLYSICLAISFGLYLFVHGAGRGTVFWVLSAAGFAGIASGIIAPAIAQRAWFFRAAVMLAVAVAVIIPVVPRMVQEPSMAAVMAGVAVWPQTLVALFGSRVLSELSELRFTDMWRSPFDSLQPAPVQSVAAALALGAFFTLVFYQAGVHLGGRNASVTGIVVSALSGDTLIHHAIVYLFFVILAFVFDAALLYWRDRSAVAAIRAVARSRGGIDTAQLRQLLDTELAPWSHTRAVRLIRDQLAAAQETSVRAAAASTALAGFHQASRRFVRGLIPFLPLLGFLGTVIGLSIALAELPHGLGSGGQREVFDISGSLAGLAVKFETTLLGLLGSMIAAFALGFLEKSESELAAECSLLVEAARQRDRADAA